MAEKQQEARGPMGGGPMGGRPMGGGKPKNLKLSMSRLIKELRFARVRIIAVIVLTILSTVGTIFIPKIISSAVNKLFAAFTGSTFEFTAIQTILLTCAILYALSYVVSLASGMLMSGIAQTAVYKMRKKVSSKLTRLPLKYYDKHTHGEILSRVTNDLDTIANSLSQSLTEIIRGVIMVVGILVMMLTIDVIMTLVTLAVVPISMGLVMFVVKRSQKYFKYNQKRLGELNGHVEEMISGHKVVRACNYEDKAIRIFSGLNEKLYETGWKSQFFSGFMYPVMIFINNLSYVLVSVIGMIFVINGRLEAGDVLAAFVPYSQQFMQPLAQMASIANVIQSTLAASERIFEIYDEEEQLPEAANALSDPKFEGAVDFENVEFSYSPDKPLITGLNISIKPGQLVAIVGPTGAGKTTIVNLIMRFYELNGGKIKIDGTDITEFSRSGLRKNIGMVLQDTWLYNGTIRENIAYGRPDASDAQIKEAAWSAQAHRFIKKLPDGYNTIINEEATNISNGQKQLLTIARAILADPAMMILDEATSSVDTITEIHIQEAMKELMRGRTSFVIAHRLSTIRNANVILVMNNGDIIEQGSHDELIAKQGFYADLFYSQFA